MKNNQLFNGALIFFLIFFGAIIFLYFNNKIKVYKQAHSEVMQMISKDQHTFNYVDLYHYLNQENNDLLIVDLREAEAYAQSHLKGSINIPFEKVLERKNLRKLRQKNKPAVLYSSSQTKSAQALLLLKSLGVDNLHIIPGSYETINKKLLSSDYPDPAYFFYNSEKARWDFNRFFGKQKSKKQTLDKHTHTIPEVPDMEPAAITGGC